MRLRWMVSLLCCLFLVGCETIPAAQVRLSVPFISQAPMGDWSEPWQNACEETSIYMVDRFYKDEAITREQAVEDIKKIFQVKNEKIKSSKDESVATMAQLVDELEVPWTTQIVSDPTIEMLKYELSAGRPVIVPVYAPHLNNPYYEDITVGLDYHVLVLTGYDDADGVFITNDPGTKDGAGLRFPYDTFMSAIHDLDSRNYLAGKKVVLFTHGSRDGAL